MKYQSGDEASSLGGADVSAESNLEEFAKRYGHGTGWTFQRCTRGRLIAYHPDGHGGVLKGRWGCWSGTVRLDDLRPDNGIPWRVYGGRVAHEYDPKTRRCLHCGVRMADHWHSRGRAVGEVHPKCKAWRVAMGGEP
jgi:hypothetical protein